MIRTPDQRVRVVVSSTLEELSEERAVVKQAIEEMRLTPVMFELGARAHPPRQLYQSYLEQSDVFIGIYWNQYGWIASDMEISGLEDEYRLSGTKPKLIYVKSSNERQARLHGLISEIEKQGSLAYKRFNNAWELQELIENDLAALLSERFLSKPIEGLLEQKIYFNSIPTPFHDLIDRVAEKEIILDLMFTKQKRLISLIGMGGTGKSRLAIEIARHALPRFKHGACFIGLASIKEHIHLESGIAMALGLSDASKQSLRETLLSYLSDKNLLLVLDNFEHVLPGAELISELLSRTHDLSILVTSRTALNLRAEHLVPLSPLSVAQIKPLQLEEALRIPALRLFIERANSVNPRIEWNPDNLDAISRICDCLGGLPLAIELAAQRVRYNTPVLLLKGMEKTLDVLSGGARDLPGRQQSFRATLDWSYNLLNEEDQKLFRILSIFQNGWYLDAVIPISGLNPDECRSGIERLIDAGLIRIKSIEGNDMRFDMLQPIDEYSEELFEKDPQNGMIQMTFFRYHIDLALNISPSLLSLKYTRDWLPRILADYENFRMAFHLAIKYNDKKSSSIIINTMANYWIHVGLQNEGLRWIKEAGLDHLIDWKSFNAEEINIYANTMLCSGIFRFFPAEFIAANQKLLIAKEMFEFIGENKGIARCLTYLGLNGLSMGDLNSADYFTEAIRIGKQASDYYSVFLAMTFQAEYYALSGNIDEAKKQLEQVEALLKDKETGAKLEGFDDLQPIFFLEKGNVFIAGGDLETAYDAFVHSIKLFEGKKLRTSLGYAVGGLGIILVLRKETAKAKPVLLNGLNIGREQGDVIIALIQLKLLVCCLIEEKVLTDIIELLDEIYAHFHYYSYSPWSVDIIAAKWIEKRLLENNMDYTFKPRPRSQGFDQLIQSVLFHFND
ncbi:MAG: DUF4062 domain-containing protein [Saprospiraceae bacterium]|nr:DUF4062 domain-containing protein [Saprospiraceae bacterium]